MRWLCFLLLASSAAAQSSGTKPLQFDLTAIPATRDSFVFAFRGAERGWAVWQYELRPPGVTRAVPHTAPPESRPGGAGRLRVVLNRQTSEPTASFRRLGPLP